MRRRFASLSLIAAAAFFTACRDNPTSTEPTALGLNGLNATMDVDGCVDQSLSFAQVDADVTSLITNLFEGSHEQSTLTMWDNLKKDKLESRPLLNHINNLTGWTLDKLGAGLLLDPDGTSGLLNATTGAVRLLDLVFRCSGETPTVVPEPAAGFDAAFELVSPNDNEDQQFNTSFEDAAAFLPAGSLEAQTLLVIARQPEDVTVNTPFPTLSRTVDVAFAGGKLKEGEMFTVLFCPIAENLGPDVYGRAVVAHQFEAVPAGSPAGAGVEYLDPPQGGALSCPDETASAWRMEKNFFKRQAMQLASFANKAWGFVGPRPLYAAHAAIGGSLGGRTSPMVVVDPYLVTEIVLTPITQPLTFGDVVNVQARLRIADVPENPAVYRGTFVNPDAVTGDVNNVGISARIDAETPSPTTIDNTSFANWSFPCVDAGAHVATVDFPQTIIPANAPVYGASTNSAPFVIDPRALTNTADAKSRVYGDPNPPLTGTLVGVQTQCDPTGITAVYATTATQTSDVGTYPITADVVFGGDVREANYTETNVGALLTITPAPLQISANDKTKVYGDANPPFDGNIVGIKNADVITLTFATTALAGSAVGSYPIVPTAVGDELTNYNITSTTNGVLTITTRTLTGSIDDKTKVQGQANPAFTGAVANVVAGDGFVVTYSSTATTGSAVGTYPITLNLGVTGGSNYTWGGTDGTLTVTPADPGGVLFGVESGSDGLSMIDVSTGAATFLGRVHPDVTKFTTPIAMSTDLTTGFLYAWNNSDGNTNETQVQTGVLLRLDPCNGLATQISTANSGVVAGALAVSPTTGRMFLIGGTLYEVNKSNGSLTTIGGPGAGSPSGADFDASGTLYLLAGTTLSTVNLTTGAVTAVATLSQSVGTIGSLVFSPSGQAIGSAFGGTQGSILFDIDVVTGTVSNIRSVTGASAPQGMGFAVACG